jgi:hypothetical protein
MEIKSMFDIVYPFVSINNENPDENEEIMQENINNISNFLSKIKLHNIINLDDKIRNQFIFLVFQEKKPNVFDTNNPEKLEDFTIMHMFNKIYSNKDKTWHTDNIRYINSFFFSDAMLCENKYDWYQIDKNSLINNNLDNSTNQNDSQNDNLNSDNSDNQSDSNNYIDLDNIDFLKNITPEYNENDNINLTLENIYDERYYVEDDLPYILHQDSIAIADWELLMRLKNLRNGVYFNPKDIRWLCLLNTLMSSEIGSQGTLVKYAKSKDYQKLKIIGTYLVETTTPSIFNNIFNETVSLSIQCDECSNKICESLEGEFWHNHEYGDLCDICYQNKKEREFMRLNYLKRQMLIEGKKVIFKKELERTKNRLQKRKVKPLTQKKRLQLLENINKQLQNNVAVFDNNYCSICMDVLSKDISAGKCGHCFHTSCINQMDNYECPLCRKVTSFFKLYLNE